MTRFLAPLALLAAALAGIAYVMYGSNQPPAPVAGQTGTQAPVPVVVASVVYDEFETTLESLGTAGANESVELTAKVTAPVEEVRFTDGMQVTRGQVLLRLAAAEELAEVRESEVRLAEQRRELERIRGLVADRNLPRQRLDEQESRVSEAEAQLEAARARVEDRVLRAPFDGVLGLRRVSAGAMVGPGSIVATLDDVSVIKLDFTVPETFLSDVARGQPVVARSAAFRGREFTGRVTTVDSRVDPATRAVIVRAEIPNSEGLLRPGMLLTVTLVQDRRRSLMIPEGALVPLRDEQFVFVVAADDRVERRQVSVGRRSPGRVEILAGLEEGMRVVTEGTTRIRPGAPVTVQRVEPSLVAERSP